MVGQGSPRTSQTRFAASGAKVAAGLCRILLLSLLALLPCDPARAEESIRVRIAFGGGAERRWEGSVAVSGGKSVGQPRRLGIEADQPGSMWIQHGRLVIRQRSAQAYDGVDLSATVSEGAKLLVQMTAADAPDKPVRFEIPLADLSNEYIDNTLDGSGNRLLVRRAPGDQLRVDFARDMLIFSPREHFSFTLEPHLSPLPEGSRVQIKVQLAGNETRRQVLAEHEVRVGQAVPIPVEVDMPKSEGVYDLIITATHIAGWSEAVRKPLNWRKTVAQRNVQVLVLSQEGPIPSVKAEGELRQIVEIDPANPRWWERLPKLPKLARMREIPLLVKGPLGNGNAKTIRHPLGKLVRLNPSSQSPDVSWQAYTLSIQEVDRPHVLEVDYPSDVPQTLGISVLEPNAAGALMPIGLDSGVDLSRAAGSSKHAPRWRRHRLIFWPRTTEPMVLITNLRDRHPAVYGKIRVLGGWEHLPRMLPAASAQHAERLWAACFDRPLFPENFSARGSLGEWIGRSLDEWQTFHQGGTRLVEYLQYVGYNGLMIAVLADGSTIYPSRLLQPTPRYDTGAFLSTGQDPVRKDVLEMLLRLFDRQRLQLIPMLEFAAPLPELETVLRGGGPDAEGIQWIGPDGKTWCEVGRASRGLAPYYNVLHPRVQQAMLNVVRELTGRYARHQSFSGLAIRLSAQGYAQLPGPEWGMDDATIARFQRDVNVQVPGSGPARFMQRASFLNADGTRQMWLQWRAAELSRFYHRMYEELARSRPDSALYLAGAEALTEVDLRPALPRRATMAEALLRVGIDVSHYQDRDPGGGAGLVLLRPERVRSTGSLNARAATLEVEQLPDFDRYFSKLPIPGSLFFQQPHEVRVASFDGKSPFDPTYLSLVSQTVPSGRQNRARFVHSLAALDTQVMVDGGWMLLLGQEDSLADLVATYRRLPAVHFQRVDQRDSSQPVTFRYGTYAGDTYLYAVNDAPFATSARIRVNASAGCRLEESTGSRRVESLRRDGEGTYWSVELRPYDMVAVKLSDPDAKFFRPKATFASSVEAELKQRIRELGARAASLRGLPPPLKIVENPGFESRAAGDDPLPGWLITKQDGVSIEAGTTHPHTGKRSARLTTGGPWACLVSRPFDPPATGRLTVSAWLRVPDATRQPSLQLTVEGTLHGEPYRRRAEVGRPAGAAQAMVPIAEGWAQYVFPVDDLPLEGLSRLQVRFDLLGPGEVWVDDVELFDLAFSDNELQELYKLITLADVLLENGQMADLLKLLEGYWPQYLEENVPLPREGIDVAQPREPTPPPRQQPPRTGFFDRLRNLVPESLRL